MCAVSAWCSAGKAEEARGEEGHRKSEGVEGKCTRPGGREPRGRTAEEYHALDFGALAERVERGEAGVEGLRGEIEGVVEGGTL